MEGLGSGPRHSSPIKSAGPSHNSNNSASKKRGVPDSLAEREDSRECGTVHQEVDSEEQDPTQLLISNMQKQVIARDSVIHDLNEELRQLKSGAVPLDVHKSLLEKLSAKDEIIRRLEIEVQRQEKRVEEAISSAEGVITETLKEQEVTIEKHIHANIELEHLLRLSESRVEYEHTQNNVLSVKINKLQDELDGVRQQLRNEQEALNYAIFKSPAPNRVV